MKKIDISTYKYSNTFALVDDEDYERLIKWNWRCAKSRKSLYAQCSFKVNGKRVVLQMHRIVLDPAHAIKKLIDHRDGYGLNNQKYNLRFCTIAQNTQNRKLNCNNKSGFKGVNWSKSSKKWQASIKSGDKCRYLGVFFCLVKAAKAYDKAAKDLFGEFARLNFPGGDACDGTRLDKTNFNGVKL